MAGNGIPAPVKVPAGTAPAPKKKSGGSGGTLKLPTQGVLSGTPPVYLPNDLLLESWMGKAAYQAALPELNKIAPKGANGLRAIIDPATVGGTTNGVPSSGDTLYSAILHLPPTVSTIVLDKTGLTGSVKGFSMSAKKSALWQVLSGADGHLGNVNMQAFYSNSSNESQVKALTSIIENNRANEQYAAIVGASASAEYTAEADADNDLATWGIDTPEMSALVQKLATNPSGAMTNVNEIMNIVRQTPTYKAAFPGLAEYNASPDAIHMTESQYMTYSQSLLDSSTQYGVPSGFMTQQEIGTLLRGHVSPTEFQQRVQDVYAAVANSDTGTKQALYAQGVTPGQLMTMWANPTKALPTLQRQVASAELTDYANRVGLTGLSQGGANQLADMAKLSSTTGNNQLGASVSGIESSLLTASRDSALLKSNPGAGTPNLDTNQLIGSQIAGFGGGNQVADQIAVGRAEAGRAAPFDRGGGYQEDAKGVTGVGSSPT
jgi:hypothetical protein